jgi:DNA repair protein RecN (Recombination protein N)
VLTHLQVTDFTLVKQLDLDFHSGLTVLTGETGAGKSILLDALSLALGDRADGDKVRAGAERAEVSACFDIDQLPQVKKWLEQADLGSDELIIRRLVTTEGRSRAYINGQPVTLTQLRDVGERLIDIHSQHEHQSLLQTVTHRRVVDAFGQHGPLVDQVKQSFTHWQQLTEQWRLLSTQSEELNARYQLLRYQVEELDQLDLGLGELAKLETRQKQLANAVQIQQSCQYVSEICGDSDDSVCARLNRALHLLDDLPVKSASLQEVESMLQNAVIQVDEAYRELQRSMNASDDDEFNLPEIEQRLSSIYDIARKHRVSPEDLTTLHQNLADELAGLQSGDVQLEQLQQAVAAALTVYQHSSQQLSVAREKSAKRLASAVNQQLQALAMAHARFEIALIAQTEPTRFGSESIEFLISTVPGQSAKPLQKIASGGELSRVSLAIQVVSAKTSITPTLVFDEVDAGIGGATGDVVGRMLRALGESTQVLCVTHLAQVASKAHHHLCVEKTVTKKGASTAIHLLDRDTQVLEIARMMGGAIDSEQSLAHAREMLVI